MKVAILYTARDQLSSQYNQDWEGRENNEDKEAVVKALQELGHKVKEFIVDQETYNLLKIEKDNIDLVFNLCDDGFFSNALLEPHIPAILDILKIPYTGSNYFSLSLCLNKSVAKSIFTQNNIPTPQFQVFETESDKLNPDLRFPLIVKPLREDASIGIKDDSIVQEETALKERVKFVFHEYKQPALVEEFIAGREFNVGLIGNAIKEILPISEIKFVGFPENKPKIVSYAAKWDEESLEFKGTVRQCPAEVDEQLKTKLIVLAQQAADTLFCQDYCRVDFRVDKDNNPYVLEVNPNPDISTDAGLAAMASAQGYQYKELVDKILKSALNKLKTWEYNKKEKK